MKPFSNLSQIFSLSWRVVVVALGYTVTLVLAGVILGVLGLLAAAPEATTNTTTVFLWTFIGSLVMGLTLGLGARQLSASAPRHLLVWGALLISNISAVIIEGYFFVPELVANLGATLIQQWLPCLVTAWLVYRLFAPDRAERPVIPPRRPWFDWVWRFGLTAVSYMVFYWIFGAINFALVTRPYYEAQGLPLAIPEPQITLIAELIRGLLIALSILPFILTAPMPWRRLMVWSGMLLFIIGGIVPLTWQAGSLPLPLLVASGVEIFCQNFATGLAAAYLLGAPVAVQSTPRLRQA